MFTSKTLFSHNFRKHPILPYLAIFSPKLEISPQIQLKYFGLKTTDEHQQLPIFCPIKTLGIKTIPNIANQTKTGEPKIESPVSSPDSYTRNFHVQNLDNLILNSIKTF